MAEEVAVVVVAAVEEEVDAGFLREDAEVVDAEVVAVVVAADSMVGVDEVAEVAAMVGVVDVVGDGVVVAVVAV